MPHPCVSQSSSSLKKESCSDHDLTSGTPNRPQILGDFASLNLIFVSFDCCSLFHGVLNTSSFLSPSPPCQIYEGWAFMNCPLPQNIWEIQIPQPSPACSSKLPAQPGWALNNALIFNHSPVSHLKFITLEKIP